MSKQETTDLSALNAPAPAGASVSEPEPKLRVPTAALDPAVQAYMNRQVAEAVQSALAQMKAAQSENSFTPGNLAAALQEAERLRRLPDADAVARKNREAREKAKTHRDISEAQQNLAALQSACDHRYQTGTLALGVIRNRPDRQAVLICFLNHCIIGPREWVIDAPAPDGTERSHIKDAHPDYGRLLREYVKAHRD